MKKSIQTIGTMDVGVESRQAKMKEQQMAVCV
jgi:hypothetical protein